MQICSNAIRAGIYSTSLYIHHSLLNVKLKKELDNQEVDCLSQALDDCKIETADVIINQEIDKYYLL